MVERDNAMIKHVQTSPDMSRYVQAAGSNPVGANFFFFFFFWDHFRVFSDVWVDNRRVTRLKRLLHRSSLFRARDRSLSSVLNLKTLLQGQVGPNVVLDTRRRFAKRLSCQA